MRRAVAIAAAALTLAGSGHALAQSDPFTRTAEGVRPALAEICAHPPAEAADPAFISRMAARFGFDAEGAVFVRTGDDGRLTVTPGEHGCRLELHGKAAMVADADKALQDFARANRLDGQVTDQRVAGEDGRRITRERSAGGRGKLTWQVFDDFNGYDKPSDLDAEWVRAQ